MVTPGRGLERPAWRMLLNARRRHRLGHGADAGGSATTSESAQRPKASSSWSPASSTASISPNSGCSTPEGVIVLITAPASRSAAASLGLLNARRRHRLGHGDRAHEPMAGHGCSTPEGVIVLITAGLTSRATAATVCSTPEGVIVLITDRRRDHPGVAPVLLNARRRHRLDHPVRRLGRCRPRRAAQRPKASSSWSPTGRGAGRPRRDACSTPEGVIVLITRVGRRRRPTSSVCSTPEGVIVLVTRSTVRGSRRIGDLLNARRRHRLDHTAKSTPVGRAGSSCSTPEGVIVSITRGRARPSRPTSACSTPEGVIVSVTRHIRPSSTSRAICSTPEGVIVLVTGPARRVRRCTSRCSTPEGVIVSITRRGRRRRRPREVCSTPEGVIVLITRGRVAGRRAGIRCSTPEGVIVLITPPTSRRLATCLRLLNARRRHRLGHAPSTGWRRADQDLLNARRRHRLDHTVAVGRRRRHRRLLNARRRHRLDHAGDAIAAPLADSPAQRPKASSSGSRLASRRHLGRERSAQRPKASSSGSPPARKSLQDNRPGMRFQASVGRRRRTTGSITAPGGFDSS